MDSVPNTIRPSINRRKWCCRQLRVVLSDFERNTISTLHFHSWQLTPLETFFSVRVSVYSRSSELLLPVSWVQWLFLSSSSGNGVGLDICFFGHDQNICLNYKSGFPIIVLGVHCLSLRVVLICKASQWSMRRADLHMIAPGSMFPIFFSPHFENYRSRILGTPQVEFRHHLPIRVERISTRYIDVTHAKKSDGWDLPSRHSADSHNALALFNHH